MSNLCFEVWNKEIALVNLYKYERIVFCNFVHLKLHKNALVRTSI